MKKVATFIGQSIVVGFVLGIIDFVFFWIIVFNSLGDDVPSSSSIFWSEILFFIITFPIQIFFSPKLEDWPFGIMYIFSLIAKAALILWIGMLFTEFRKGKIITK